MSDTESLTYYKVLRNGRSCNGGDLTWSLPDKKQPGNWHEVQGELVQCRNGLHLTSDPFRRGGRSAEIYLAEYEGDTLGPFGDELVCRKVRLLKRLTERDFMSREEREREARQRAAAKAAREATRAALLAKNSPAYELAKHVWEETPRGSWRRLNDAMFRAVTLAIVSGMRFNPGDFQRFESEFNSSYWISDGEHAYALACGRERGAYGSDAHGGNASAVQAIERWKGRRPFIVQETAQHDARKIRLCVGARFDWHIGLTERISSVRVTSFNDKNATLTACSYVRIKRKAGTDWEREDDKIDKRFTISHEDIAAYHKAIREHAKQAGAASKAS